MGTTQSAHINRIYHMHRRITEQATPVERRKDPWIAGLTPPAHAGTNRKKALADSTSPWLPEDTFRCAALFSPSPFDARCTS